MKPAAIQPNILSAQAQRPILRITREGRDAKAAHIFTSQTEKEISLEEAYRYSGELLANEPFSRTGDFLFYACRRKDGLLVGAQS